MVERDEEDGATRVVSVGSLIANLPELVVALAAQSGNHAVVCEFPDGRYIQVWVDQSGYVQGEIESNDLIGDGERLTPDDELALERLGFSPPRGGNTPNWWRRVEGRADVMDLLMSLGRATLEALHATSDQTVGVRSFPVRR